MVVYPVFTGREMVAEISLISLLLVPPAVAYLQQQILDILTIFLSLFRQL
jgi:hypothetical protein